MRTNEEMRIDGSDWLISLCKLAGVGEVMISISSDEGTSSADINSLTARKIAEFLNDAGRRQEED